jgi:hypothetical protein
MNLNCTLEESLERSLPVSDLAKELQTPLRGHVSCVVACPCSSQVPPSRVAHVVEQLLTLGCHEPSLLSWDSDPDGSIHRESLEKFHSEAAKVQVALDNASISEPSLLLGVLVHVQVTTDLLQRQTLELTCKLGANGVSEHGDILMVPNSKMADLEKSMEVVCEIEMLFEGCAKILNEAMIMAVGEQSVNNDTVAEHRKNFALERLILNQLRKRFAEVGANLKGGGAMDSSNKKRLLSSLTIVTSPLFLKTKRIVLPPSLQRMLEKFSSLLDDHIPNPMS